MTTNAAMAGMAREYQPGGTADISDIYDSPLSTIGVTNQDATWHQIKVASRYLADYKRALSRGELARVADDLVAVSRRPITGKLVTDLNTQLGVQTPLADEQIAKAAAAKQKLVS